MQPDCGVGKKDEVHKASAIMRLGSREGWGWKPEEKEKRNSYRSSNGEVHLHRRGEQGSLSPTMAGVPFRICKFHAQAL